MGLNKCLKQRILALESYNFGNSWKYSNKFTWCPANRKPEMRELFAERLTG